MKKYHMTEYIVSVILGPVNYFIGRKKGNTADKSSLKEHLFIEKRYIDTIKGIHKGKRNHMGRIQFKGLLY